MIRRHYPLAISPFDPQDLHQMAPSALALREMALTDRSALAFARAQEARGFSARDARGRVVCCAGASVIHARYATLWAIYADSIGPAAAAGLIRATRHFIDLLRNDFARVDALVSVEEVRAIKWARACGLSLEATLAEANPAGGDFLVFRKVWV